jgi:hypothetical protein
LNPEVSYEAKWVSSFLYQLDVKKAEMVSLCRLQFVTRVVKNCLNPDDAFRRR